MAAVRFSAEDLAPYVGRRLTEVICFPYAVNPESLANMVVLVDAGQERMLSQAVEMPPVGEYVPVSISLEEDVRIPEGVDLYVGYGFQETGENQPFAAVYPGKWGNSYYTPFNLEKSAWRPLYQKKAGFYMDLMLQTRLEEVPANSLTESGYACIALPDGPLRAGDTLDLEVLMPENSAFDTLLWSLDGETQTGTQLVLPAGEHTLEAQVRYKDAREEILRAHLTVY